MINTGAYVNSNEWKIPDDQVEYDEYITNADGIEKSEHLAVWALDMLHRIDIDRRTALRWLNKGFNVKYIVKFNNETYDLSNKEQYDKLQRYLELKYM